MKRYTTNAIYEYLKEKKDALTRKYLFIEEDSWLLIYGTADAVPRLVLIASSLKDGLEGPFSDFEKTALSITSYFPLPVRMLRFTPGRFHEAVSISDESNRTLSRISGSQLYDKLFAGYQLPADANALAKPVNSATSSEFHDWQRNFLSGRIKVSDIDLIRYGEDYKPLVIFELKRSYQDLHRWVPYRDDYPNFILLRRTIPAAIPIFILYNKLYKGNPRIEDISKIRAFKIEDDKPGIVSVKHSDTNPSLDFTPEEIFR